MGAVIRHGRRPDITGERTGKSAGFSEVWLVQLDDSEEPALSMYVSGIPQIFDSHPVVPSARVRRHAFKGIGGQLYEVTVDYETPPDSEDPEQESEQLDPTEDAPKLLVGWEEREEVVVAGYKTGTGRDLGPRIETSAGEAPDTPVVRQRANLTFEIVVNKFSADAFTVAASYLDCINSEIFLGLPAKSVRLVGVKPQTKYRNGVLYLQLTYSFKCQFPDWDHRQLDIGSYYYDSTTGTKTEFKSKEGSNVQGLLDGGGDALPDGEDPVYLDPVQIYPSRDFAGLGLPSSGWVFG